METLLSEEMATYTTHREQLLGRAKGKYVLIKRDRILGEFESRRDALQRGYDEYGNAPFLVKRIVETEMPIYLLHLMPTSGVDRAPYYPLSCGTLGGWPATWGKFSSIRPRASRSTRSAKSSATT